jgi:hypothetical protein
MLQPDLFFSYGLSSGLALAAGKKLTDEKSVWINKYFMATVLWLSVFFIPQVLYLLWRYPYWESMFWAKQYSDLPAWLVSLYPAAIIVMGALGFYITCLFLKRKNLSAAIAQAGWSFAVALIIIIVGWDGTGYERLLYAGTGLEWASGVAYPLTDFFKSPVFITLLWLEALILIPYAIIFIRWARET